MIDLSIIVKQYPQCLASRAKLVSILHDLYPQSIREINLILASYDCGISETISQLSYIDSFQMNSFTKKLEQEYGYQREFAYKSIEPWAAGYSCAIWDEYTDFDRNMISDRVNQPGIVYTISCDEYGEAGLCRLAIQLTDEIIENDADISQTMIAAIQTAEAYLDEKRFTGIIADLAKRWKDTIGTDRVIDLLNKASTNSGRTHYLANFYDTHNFGTSKQLVLSLLISVVSAFLIRPIIPRLAVIGDITSDGTILEVEKLEVVLQECLKRGAKTVLLPSVSKADLSIVSADLRKQLHLVFFDTLEDALYTALSVE